VGMALMQGQWLLELLILNVALKPSIDSAHL
jgi:hypothetical protein